MQQIIQDLERLRSRSRVMLLAQRVSVMIAWTLGSLLALIGIDYLLRLPSAVRLTLLLGGIAALVYVLQRYVLSAVRFRPTLTQIALRVERSLPALSGRLASSVEFAAAGIDRENVLAARSVRDTDSRMAGEAVGRVMQPAQTLRDVAILLVVASVAVWFVTMYPASAATGASRILLPYGAAAWPARTGVVSLMDEIVPNSRVHPRGQTLPLRARVTRGELDQRVDATYRFEIDGQLQPWRHVVLTQQGASDVHERLVDAGADAIELYFSTQDDQTPVERITIVPPPAVQRAHVTITPPEYAANYIAPFEAELGPGTDSRAATERPSLAGSTVTMTLELNKPIPAPDESSLGSALGWTGDLLPQFAVDSNDPRLWHVSWTLADTRDLSLHLVDEHGLANVEHIGYRIEAVDDLPPSVTIIQPQADQAVLATAVVPLISEAQDDVAVASLSLEARRQDDETTEPLWQVREERSSPSAQLAADLELSPLNLAEGDVVLVTSFAEDVFALHGRTHEPTVSPVRRLRIISELDFATQMRRQLGVVRQNAVRIESLQTELQDSVRDDGVQPGTERAQAQLSERIAAQREAVQALREQMRTNRLDDDQLESLMDQSSDLLDFAGRAATEAVEAAADRAAGAAEDDEDLLQAQQEVREELADLIELLDRDEDTWVITRQLENIMAEQTRLQEQTAQLHEQTIGQSIDEMSQEDLSELDRIARAQRELRDDARRLVDDLRRRAQAMQEVDPQSSSAMRRAADTAEQRQLDRDLEAASDRAQQNQLRNAQADQQAAAETMRRMLDDIEETRRAQVEQLLRQLASLKESIERLIFVQENELSALANARVTGEYSGRDRAMIRLNQNTQSVASEARAAGQQARRIARTLDRAADAQGAAVSALRSDPVDADAAEQAEERSLELLNEASELAEQLEQEARDEELQRRREELIDAYRALAERQVTLRSEAVELGQHEQLNRRQLVEARRLGSQQDEIRTALEDLERSVQEILESAIFSHVHRRISEWSQAVTDSLSLGDAGITVTDRQAMIAQSIGRLIEALEQSMQPPDEFAQDQDAGGEGEGGEGGEQPLIPPITELRLLRGLQEEVYNRTKAMDARRDLNDVQRREILRELGQQQRDLLDLGQRMLEQLQ